MNLELWPILESNAVDIDDENGNTVATFKIDQDEHGWRWWLIYTDKTRVAKVGRF